MLRPLAYLPGGKSPTPHLHSIARVTSRVLDCYQWVATSPLSRCHNRAVGLLHEPCRPATGPMVETEGVLPCRLPSLHFHTRAISLQIPLPSQHQIRPMPARALLLPLHYQTAMT